MAPGAARGDLQAQPSVQIPIKGDYYRHDFSRTARFKNIAFNYPSRFPIAAIHASRAFYWLRDRDATQARALANRYYHAFFVEDLDISHLDNTLGLAAEFGVDRTALGNALADPAAKDRLKREVDAAIGRGVRGSRFFFIDGKPSMGSDPLDQVEHWLSTGGWRLRDLFGHHDSGRRARPAILSSTGPPTSSIRRWASLQLSKWRRMRARPRP